MLWTRKGQIQQQIKKEIDINENEKVKFVKPMFEPLLQRKGQNIHMMTGNGATGPNGLTTLQEIFNLNLRDSVDPQSQSVQIWHYNIPVLQQNEKKIIMEVLGGQLYILNLPSATFPNQIGYLDKNGDPSNIIAIFKTKQIIPNTSGVGVTYTIIYSICQPLSWDLGLNRQLTFTFGDEEGQFQTPLAEKVGFQMKLIHVSY